MAVGNRAFRSRRLRKRSPGGFAERIENITKPVDRPPSAPEFGSGVLPPGVSRYQRNSAHLPSGVTRFAGIGVLPADVAIDMTSDDPALDLT
jgi:hypothetical protein